jgi:hypothetical protein
MEELHQPGNGRSMEVNVAGETASTFTSAALANWRCSNGLVIDNAMIPVQIQRTAQPPTAIVTNYSNFPFIPSVSITASSVAICSG